MFDFSVFFAFELSQHSHVKANNSHITFRDGTVVLPTPKPDTPKPPIVPTDPPFVIPGEIPPGIGGGGAGWVPGPGGGIQTVVVPGGDAGTAVLVPGTGGAGGAGGPAAAAMVAAPPAMPGSGPRAGAVLGTVLGLMALASSVMWAFYRSVPACMEVSSRTGDVDQWDNAWRSVGQGM